MTTLWYNIPIFEGAYIMPSDIKILNELSEKFLADLEKAIEDAEYDWHKPWISVFREHRNGVSNYGYKSINYLFLNYIAEQRGYQGSRWYTFLQIKDKGYRFKENSKGTGVPVVGYFKVDKYVKKTEAEIAKDPDGNDKKKVSVWQRRNTIVFNEDHLIGIPELTEETIDDKLNHEIEPNDYLTNVIEHMGIKVNYAGSRAFYRPIDDTITIPPKEYFESQVAFEGTLAHELGHATGHKNRLNRDLEGSFGTQKYAFEELCAEFASMFVGMHINVNYTNYDQDQSLAYLKTWSRMIKGNPDYLHKAIKTGWDIMEYMNDIADVKFLQQNFALENDEAEL